jgi:hypothetical protein
VGLLHNSQVLTNPRRPSVMSITFLSSSSIFPRLPLKCFLFFVFAVLVFELTAYTLNHSKWFFLWCFFQDSISWSICPRLASNHNPPISASWVARITGVSH